jgi:hypothetical protein
MSYCRWSNDNYQCDVYCFESVCGGFDIHVAARRYVSDKLMPELPDKWWDPPPEKMLAVFQRREQWLENADLVPVGGEYEGESFHKPDLAACAERLEMLREAGYRVPQYAIDALRAEAEEDNCQGTPP